MTDLRTKSDGTARLIGKVTQQGYMPRAFIPMRRNNILWLHLAHPCGNLYTLPVFSL